MGVAGRTQGRHAGAVLAPLVFPELFVRAVGGGYDGIILWNRISTVLFYAARED